MTYMKSIILFLGLTLLVQFGYAQDTIVFYLAENQFFKPTDSYVKEFLDSLPDAVYVQYDVKRKDSCRYKKNNIVALGRFKNRLKDGKFEYNTYTYKDKRKNVRISEQYSSFYSLGKKDGVESLCRFSICGYVDKIMIYHKQYKMGKKDGPFMYYEDGSLLKLEIYENDGLKATFKYEKYSPPFPYEWKSKDKGWQYW